MKLWSIFTIAVVIGYFGVSTMLTACADDCETETVILK